MALRESALNGYSPTGKVLVCILWKNVRFLKGERGKPIYWCMLFRINSLLSFLVFFPFLSIFVLIFFLLLLLCFSFHVVRNPLFFDPFYRARQGSLYSACRDQCFTVLPLNRLCLVWVHLPIVQNPCQTEADSFCPSMRRELILSCPSVRRGLPRC